MHIETYNFVRLKVTYLLGPITANNDTMLNPAVADGRIPYTVLINIFKSLVGNNDYVVPIYPFTFNVYPGYLTNVSGIFGELIYCSGYMLPMLYVTVLFFFINAVSLCYRTKGKMYLTFCYLHAILPYLFFCNFFSVSGVVLPLLLSVFFDVFSNFRIGRFHI